MERDRPAIDLLVHGASELATPEGRAAHGGLELGRVRRLAHGAIAIRGGRIVAVGHEDELGSRFAPMARLDAAGGLILPGFIDAHTHPVFAGDRAEEYEQRARGASYADLAREGGGILSSVRGVRAASRAELTRRLLERLDRFLALGTTTIEAKSGYGLSSSDELKCLEALEAAGHAHPVEVVPTFLGAHAIPEEHRARPERYLDLVVEEMLPLVAARGLARFCDVFVETIAFSPDDTRRIAARARELGLGLRLHVDQLTDLGGAALAAELGAVSADHLEHASERGIAALVAAGTIPVLCPLVPLVLRENQEAPARRMVGSGLAPALATDFNPGSCFTQSLLEVVTFASLRYGFTAEECLTAITLNAAASLGLAQRIGTLEEGKQADLVVLDVTSLAHLAYDFGRDRVLSVVKQGRVVHARAEPARYYRTALE